MNIVKVVQNFFWGVYKQMCHLYLATEAVFCYLHFKTHLIVFRVVRSTVESSIQIMNDITRYSVGLQYPVYFDIIWRENLLYIPCPAKKRLYRFTVCHEIVYTYCICTVCVPSFITVMMHFCKGILLWDYITIHNHWCSVMWCLFCIKYQWLYID